MNIDEMRNIVLQGQIATLTAQIETWNIYADRTGEDVSSILSEIQSQIALIWGYMT
jgi:hypothetical protein